MKLTLGIKAESLELICLPPWPSKTAKSVDLGQFGKKQSCTNEAK